MGAATATKFRWPARNALAEDILRWAFDELGDKVAISTSFQATGMAILDMAACLTGGDVRVFSLDTGRIHQETYDLVEQVRRRYGIEVEMLAPDAGELTRMLTLHGPNLFYDSVAKRRLCCEIRKVRPLERKLATLDAWITGLRRSQSQAREAVSPVELDEEHGGILKIAPLASWTEQEIWEYIRRNDVPYHKLYDNNYTSIGCAPCTRATEPGEKARAGRWWWEEDDADKECGIHVSPGGRIRRSFDILLEEVLPRAR